MRINLIILLLILMSCKSTKVDKDILIQDKYRFKEAFLSLCFETWIGDSLYFNKRHCYASNVFDSIAINDVIRLSNRVDFELNNIDEIPLAKPSFECVGIECLKIYHSEELDKLANEFINRKDSKINSK